MNKANEKYLFDNFYFFSKRDMQSCKGVYFHCGDGWFEIVKELCEQAQALGLKRFKVTHVKEKLGGLRFYYECPGITKIEENALLTLIYEAEQKCDVTCESCSKPAKLRKIAWQICTLCDECVSKK